jgi:hypothetical protein
MYSKQYDNSPRFTEGHDYGYDEQTGYEHQSGYDQHPGYDDEQRTSMKVLRVVFDGKKYISSLTLHLDGPINML